MAIQTTGTDEDIEISTGRFDNAIFIDDSASSIDIGTTNPDTALHIGGSDAVITIAETSNTPSNPDQGTEARIYVKGDKLIVQFNDGGTLRYKYLNLSGIDTLWHYSATAP